MADKPIIFSAPMVRALLEGRKTQTRRVLKPQPIEPIQPLISFNHGVAEISLGPNCKKGNGDLIWWQLPAPHDRLWVRERGAIAENKQAFHPYVGNEPSLADGRRCGAWPRSPNGKLYKPCPSIHMPRWASRLTLIVEGAKVERLQDISRGDAMQEGCPFPNMQDGPDPRDWFRELWNTIHGPGAWEANPWIYALTFRVVKGNIDEIGVP